MTPVRSLNRPPPEEKARKAVAANSRQWTTSATPIVLAEDEVDAAEHDRVQRRPPLDEVAEALEAVAVGDAAAHLAEVVGVEVGVGRGPDRPHREHGTECNECDHPPVPRPAVLESPSTRTCPVVPSPLATSLMVLAPSLVSVPPDQIVARRDRVRDRGQARQRASSIQRARG